MPRPDYERLKMLCKTTEFGKYTFEFPSEKKDFVYAYGKMYDKTTTLVENTRYKTKRGIYIDIFPLDGAGDAYDEIVHHFQEIRKKIHLLSTKTCAWRKGRKLYKNVAVVAMRCVPEFLISAVKIRREIDEKCKALGFDDCRYVANFNGAWGEKEVVKRVVYGTRKSIPSKE